MVCFTWIVNVLGAIGGVYAMFSMGNWFWKRHKATKCLNLLRLMVGEEIPLNGMNPAGAIREFARIRERYQIELTNAGVQWRDEAQGGHLEGQKNIVRALTYLTSRAAENGFSVPARINEF